MSGARVISVGTAALAGDDPAGRLVARALLAQGLPVGSRQVVDEDDAALEPALRAALETPGVIVLLAPPGGSAGDLVRRALSRLAGARLVLNPKLLSLLEADFARRGQAMPRRRDRLALLPQGALLWAAPEGEPGWALEMKQSLVSVLPAGSAHLEELVEQHLLPAARARLGGGEVTVVRTLLTAGLGPTDAEELLGPWLGREGPVVLACVVADGDVWVRLTARGPSRAAAEAALRPVEEAVRRALGEHCYGQDEDTLEAAVGRLLLERRLSVAVAESCTGGLVGHRLTNVPGSSRYVERGVIVYSNRAKEELLGLPAELLRQHGAVSAQVAQAMVAGICRVAGTQCGLAVTGIAGPDGGTPAKPVGTVFIAAAAPVGVEIKRFQFAGGREAVKWQSSQAALDMLRRALLRAK
ncbi:MAG TPA: nicotinamide-nucleotide amidohydrolase family protein [Methylomirabilota bacterium]|nr:nicotinamide-nucleotide amidohydrolase family protein [Methylomirabilota bacterium]